MKKNYFQRLRFTLLVCISFLLFQSCEKDDTTDLILEQKQEKTKTVSKDEAFQFLNSTNQNKSSLHYFDLNYDKAFYENIDRFPDSLFVVPTKTVLSSNKNDIYLLRVNDSIKASILHYYPTGKTDKKNFTGTIITTDIAGNFLMGYKMQSGYLLATYTSKIENKSKTKNNQKSGECNEDLNTNSDFCEQDLEEVIITTAYKPPVTYIAYTSIVPPVTEDEYPTSGGYTSGGGGGSSPTTTENPPPSCKSFDFKNVATDWQAAVISEFYMRVKVGTMSNYQHYEIKIPLLTFETWSKDRFNNTLSTGAAAELSAESIQKAAWDTVKHFQDKYDFSEYDVNRWFEDRLKQVFRERSDGGSVRRGNPYNLNSKKYETGKMGGCA